MAVECLELEIQISVNNRMILECIYLLEITDKFAASVLIEVLGSLPENSQTILQLLTIREAFTVRIIVYFAPSWLL